MKYRKKPVVVDAVQWFPDPSLGRFDDCGLYWNKSIGNDVHGVEYLVAEVGIQTLEGFMYIKPGDWIITGVKGERYPCKDEIFRLTYEPVED